MTKTTVRDAKACLATLLEKLNRYDESTEFKCEFDDSFGGSYIGGIDDLDVSMGADGVIYFTNI